MSAAERNYPDMPLVAEYLNNTTYFIRSEKKAVARSLTVILPMTYTHQESENFLSFHSSFC